MHERPDGSTSAAIGWGLIVLGVLAGFFASAAETPDGFWFSLALANLGVGLGVLLVSLGYLVRAIWHLPGREIPQEPKRTETFEPTMQVCEYCGLEIAAPLRPCSAVSADELIEMQDQIDDEKCLVLLRERNVLPRS